jgi:hypothetical protein
LRREKFLAFTRIRNPDCPARSPVIIIIIIIIIIIVRKEIRRIAKTIEEYQQQAHSVEFIGEY